MSENLKEVFGKVTAVGNIVMKAATNKKVMGLFRLAGALFAVSKAVDAVTKMDLTTYLVLIWGQEVRLVMKLMKETSRAGFQHQRFQVLRLRGQKQLKNRAENW